MSYVDWSHLPRRDAPPPPPFHVLLGYMAGLVPFVILGILAGMANDTGMLTPTGLELLGP